MSLCPLYASIWRKPLLTIIVVGRRKACGGALLG